MVEVLSKSNVPVSGRTAKAAKLPRSAKPNIQTSIILIRMSPRATPFFSVPVTVTWFRFGLTPNLFINLLTLLSNEESLMATQTCRNRCTECWRIIHNKIRNHLHNNSLSGGSARRVILQPLLHRLHTFSASGSWKRHFDLTNLFFIQGHASQQVCQ
jgi:hypothetical protein